MTKQRVVVGLSGGVDSAVTAYLLKQAGHEVIGVFMKNWEGDDDDQYCASRQDFLDAASVADQLGIEFDAVNFAADYKDRVFAIFLQEYAAGRTPNPDILCNSEIKFNAFLDHALRLGADALATGHYACVDGPKDARSLRKGHDASKDQSYFLHRLNQRQLAPAMFPLGEMRKTEVRAIAQELGLANAKKPDSTGICFIGERPFRAFLQNYLAHQPGPMVDDQGRVVGEHIGLSFYTLGQRKGIGLGGSRDAEEGQAWYVARKDMQHNRLIVVRGHDHPWLHQQQLDAEQAHWIRQAPQHGERLTAKTRYRQQDAGCIISLDVHHPDRFHVDFDQAQFAVTPGQSVVLYRGDECLGGGVIANAK